MKISFIGAGRVAYHLANALYPQHQIVQIYARTQAKTQILATMLQAEAIESYQDLSSDIDILILAVSDQVIAEVIQSIPQHLHDVLIVHTSGSTHLEVLSNVHANSGVLYPLQTFSLQHEIDWKNVPVFVETQHSNDLKKLSELASSLTEKIYHYSSEQRLSLHLAAVFACNFTNYCYDMAQQITQTQQVDFDLLYPLIQATAEKALCNIPKNVQTGPAMRGDQNILHMHTAMLEKQGQEDFKQVYQLLSEQILKRHA